MNIEEKLEELENKVNTLELNNHILGAGMEEIPLRDIIYALFEKLGIDSDNIGTKVIIHQGLACLDKLESVKE